MDAVDAIEPSPGNSINGDAEKERKDPESIVYEVGREGEKKEATVGKDGSVDAESAELAADTTIDTSLQLVTKALDVTDDPSEHPYTFRAFAIGLGLSAFGAIIAEIFYFKPQTVNVNTIFLIIIAYCVGEATTLIPRWGPVGRLLNPGPFNQKEHVFVVIMASSAATCALGTEQLAVQNLYYGEEPNPASAIFLLLSSQCIGYGLLGLMRKVFVYPTKFVWPVILPQASLFQSMHLDKALARKRLRMFWYVCVAIMVWELVPEYIFPWTVGISIFCLANQNSAVFTYLFGGSNGDEGLGFLSWCMDWQYIGTDELVIPLNTLLNQLIGYFICIALTIAAYYGNVWNALSFPFMGQVLFTANGSQYNQTMILNAQNEVDPELLEAYGLPWFSTSNALSLLVMNMGVTAAVVHILLWNWNDIKFVFSWLSPFEMKRLLLDGIKSARQSSLSLLSFFGVGHGQEPAAEDDAASGSTSTWFFPGTEGDPHFAAMAAYKESPSWWYHLVLVFAVATGLVCCYQQNTGLPWWAFLVAVALCWFLTIIYACMYGIVGFYYQPVSAIQMIGSYMVPARPVANMMFTLYGSNGLTQALLMLQDLKLAHYSKLPPRATFVAQIVGTCVGAILNWVMMNSIVTNQREVLLSVEGTNLWSGQNVQSYNAQAVAWGGTGNQLFGRDGTYWMVPMGLFFGIFVPIPLYIGHKYFPKLRLDYINTFIICTWLGWLSVGINSSILPYFLFGFFVQGYLRRYKPAIFAKWNLIVTAGIAGGCSIIIFILTFAVDGGSGVARPFPAWWGNNLDGNMDRCLYMD